VHHLLLSRFHDLPHRAFREMSATYGPLMLLRFGSVPTLVVSSAEAARELMRTHDLAFCSRHLSATLDIISFGGRDILFSPYNDSWRELRKVCVLELFSHRRVLSFRPVREHEVARLVASISAECGGGGGEPVVNLSDGICRVINDIVVRTAIGDRCEYRDEYLHELEEAVRLASGLNLADLYPSSRLVRRFSAAARDMERCRRKMYRVIESIIQERKASPMPERVEDLLGVLLRLQRDGGLQIALTNELVSTVIFVRSPAYLAYDTCLLLIFSLVCCK
jgi:cytochrome P450